MHNWKRSILFTALAAFVAGIMFTGGCALAGRLGLKPGSDPLTPKIADAAPIGNSTVADIVKQAGPAVVKIDTVVVSNSGGNNPLFNDPFFRQFFGGVPGGFGTRPQVERGIGSGFIISKDGYIVTNDHVIDGAQKISVTIQGQSKPLPAKVVGSDYDLDLAVLKVNDSQPLPTLAMGNSDQMRVGDWVIAIGNPYGLDHTVTVGVISAKGRPIQVENRQYKNLLQTDASINPGNSGGPLINLSGQVIGINTAVAQAQGIGFAIPTSTVQDVLSKLMKGETVAHPWLGVQMQSVDQQVASALGLAGTRGALVVGVVPGSPAANAGLQQGDVIVKIDSKAVNSPQDLADAVSGAKVGQRMVLQVYRNGSPHYMPLTVGQAPAR
ncbi:S1C family serine protease [Desulfotomaculum copahuensis]|uniref:Peptidase S1 n=1 Tax=Desulfotomaculum copahuensis TaxID=1838280 RepID=A0A1B7LF17_9FIRM|nr:trypsin-like peptidase domain-containing protein [Desulfotomaculum copahuensis]OAT81826.1 peptidase S1 [Desulfotomaculum copahuensis]